MVTAVGPGLTGTKVGDSVAYAGWLMMGSYTEERILPENCVVPVPPSVDSATAAAIMLKGMTAQFLLRRCFQASSLNISIFFIAIFSSLTRIHVLYSSFLLGMHA